MRTISIAPLLVLTCSLAAQAQNNSTLTVSGTTNAVAINTGFNYTLQGTATLSGIGNAVFFTSGNVASVSDLNVASIITGTFSLIFPQGDVLSGTTLIPAGLFIPSLGQSTNATATVTVTGGTGRFAGASGSYPGFMISGMTNGATTSTFQGTGAGTLSLPSYKAAGTLSYSGLLTHLASGGGWKTTIVMVNNGTAAAQTRLSFFDDRGLSLTLPFTFPQGSISDTATSTYSTTIPAGAEVILETQGPDSTLSTGSAQFYSDGSVAAFLIFRFVATGQEASVPLLTGTTGAYVIPFDTTVGLTTALAVATASLNTTAIPVTVRDDKGAILASDTITLNPQGHLSLVITDRYPSAANRRGTITFQSPAGAQIGAIAIRATSAGAYTTVPPSIR